MYAVLRQLLLVVCFIEIPVVNINSIDPDQTLHAVMSALFASYPFSGF